MKIPGYKSHVFESQKVRGYTSSVWPSGKLGLLVEILAIIKFFLFNFLIDTCDICISNNAFVILGWISTVCLDPGCLKNQPVSDFLKLLAKIRVHLFIDRTSSGNNITM